MARFLALLPLLVGPACTVQLPSRAAFEKASAALADAGDGQVSGGDTSAADGSGPDTADAIDSQAIDGTLDSGSGDTIDTSPGDAPEAGCTDGSACDDGNACTVGDKCSGGACLPGSATSCDDGQPCTTDGCTPATGCSHTPDDKLTCSDGSACTLGDKCQGGACLPGEVTACNDNNPCTTDGCDPAAGCTHTTADGVACDDGDACTVQEVCKASACAPGSPKNCDDGNSCTTDACTAGTGACTHAPLGDGVGCEDGNACTGTAKAPDSCNKAVCQPGGPVDCLDGDSCTADTCDAKAGCKHEVPGDAAACPSQLNACWVSVQCGGGCKARPKLFKANVGHPLGVLKQPLVGPAGSGAAAGLAVAAVYSGGGVTGGTGTDLLLARLDAAGGLAWRMVAGTDGVDTPTAVRALPDGRLVVVASLKDSESQPKGGELGLLVASADGQKRALVQAGGWPDKLSAQFQPVRHGARVLAGGDVVALASVPVAGQMRCAIARFATGKGEPALTDVTAPLVAQDLPGGFRTVIDASALPWLGGCVPVAVVEASPPSGGPGLAVLANVHHATENVDVPAVIWLDAATGKVVGGWTLPAQTGRLGVGLWAEGSDLTLVSRAKDDPDAYRVERLGKTGWLRWRQNLAADTGLQAAAEVRLLPGTTTVLISDGTDSRLLHLGDPLPTPKVGLAHAWSRSHGSLVDLTQLPDDTLVATRLLGGQIEVQRLDPFGNATCTATCAKGPDKSACKPTCIEKDGLSCDDGDACSEDDCGPDDGSDGCQHPPSPTGSPCDDGSTCTLDDTCKKSGTAMVCSGAIGGAARFDNSDGKTAWLPVDDGVGPRTWREAVTDPSSNDLWLVGQSDDPGSASKWQGRIRRLSATGSGSEVKVDVFTGPTSSSRQVDATAVAPMVGGGVVVCGEGSDSTGTTPTRVRWVHRYRTGAAGKPELVWKHETTVQANNVLRCDAVVGLPGGQVVVAGRGSALSVGMVIETLTPDGKGGATGEPLSLLPTTPEALTFTPTALARLTDGRLVLTGAPGLGTATSLTVAVIDLAKATWTWQSHGQMSGTTQAVAGTAIVALEEGGFAALGNGKMSNGTARALYVRVNADGQFQQQTLFRDELLPQYMKSTQEGFTLSVLGAGLAALPDGEVGVLNTIVEHGKTSGMPTPTIYHAWLVRLDTTGKAHVANYPPYGTQPGGGQQSGGGQPGQPPKIYAGLTLAGFADGSLAPILFERTGVPPGQLPGNSGTARVLRLGRHQNVPPVCDACDAAQCQDTNACTTEACTVSSGQAQCKAESKSNCDY